MKNYIIRYFPLSSPSQVDPGNWGMVCIQIDGAKNEQEALSVIPEPYQRGSYQIWEAA